MIFSKKLNFKNYIFSILKKLNKEKSQTKTYVADATGSDNEMNDLSF